MEISNWQTKTIAELGNYAPTTVQTGPFGSQLHSDDYVDEGIPLILIRNIGDNGLTGDLPKITEEDAKRLARYSLLPGDIVFSRVGRVGSCFLAAEENRGWIISGQTLRIRLSYNEIDPNYLIYAIRNKEAQDFISGSSVGSTRSSINTSILESLPVRVPPLKQQQKIAEVLVTIDRTIAQTEALIAKHQRIKTGLMQDLLTRGIDEHGQLRDPSTHRFKSTPLGMIPEEWEVTTLGSFLDRYNGFVQTGPFGSQLHAEEYVPSGIPTIMPKDITDGQILTDVIDHITEEKAKSLSRHRVKPNDVIFARRGDLSRAAAISEREQGWLCGTGCFLLRAPKSKLDATWLAMTYRFPSIQRQVAANAIGSTMPNLNGQVMKGLIFAFPTFEEQVAIVERLVTESKMISQNVQRVNKLLKTKQGLMQDLLSGRVSVKGLMEG